MAFIINDFTLKANGYGCEKSPSKDFVKLL